MASAAPGLDGGSKINAALSISDEVWVDSTISPIITAVRCGAGKHIHFLPETYFYSSKWTLESGCEIEASSSGIDYDFTNFSDPPVVLQESDAGDLPCSFNVAGMNVVFDSIAIRGNFGWSSGNVGICTDTTSKLSASRGFAKLRRVTVEGFSGDNLQLTCTSSGNTFYDQAMSWQIDDSTFTRSRNGNDLTIQGCTDLRVTDSYFALAGGYCIRNINSTITVRGGDVSSCNLGGIYETGSGHYANSVATMVIDGVTGFEVPQLTSGASASLNGAIVIQGYDGTYCNGANGNRIVNTTFVSPGPPTVNNISDMIHIENANNNIIANNFFEGEPAGSANETRFAYYHTSSFCAQTAGGDVLTGNQFVGQFGTDAFLATSVDIFGSNNETAHNAMIGLARLTNHYLPNNQPLYCGNAAGMPQACLYTDNNNNTVVSGDATAGALLLRARGESAGGQIRVTSSGSSASGGWKIADQGTCKMSLGTCPAQTFGHKYASPPQCFASWTGGGILTGLIKVPSTTANVTPASSVNTDTAEVNWQCLGQ